MDKLIRKSDAIEAIEFGITYAKMMDADGRIKPLFENENRELGKAIERIKDIPAVEPCKDAVSRAWLLNELARIAGLEISGITQIGAKTRKSNDN